MYLNSFIIKSYFVFKKLYTVNRGEKYKILYYPSLTSMGLIKIQYKAL